MNIDFGIIVCLLIIHFIADFIAQSNWMASNKSHNIKALTLHTLSYSWILFGGILCLIPAFHISFYLLLLYVIFNGLIHFLVDLVTSKISSYFWARKDYHNFFVTVGEDQTIHYLTLFWSFYFFFA